MQNTTLHFEHLNIFMVCLFCGLHTTLYLFAILRPVITILHFETDGGRVGLPCGVVWVWNTLSPPVIPWIRGAQGQDCLLSVDCLSLSLSLLFTVTFKYPVLLWRHFPKYLALRIQLNGTCVANDTCLQQTVSHSLQADIIKPYHSFLYTELHLKSFEEMFIIEA
jgi:hypothetical protein